MHLSRHACHARGSTSWRVFLCLAVVAMLWRAMIPTGYMPDLSAARDGSWVLTVCTASGDVATVTVDLGGHGGEATSDLPSGDDCPFGLLTGQDGILGHALSTAAWFDPAATTGPSVYRAAPALPAQGPPLGPRAPPRRLV